MDRKTYVFRTLLVLLMVATALLPAATAVAQGTSGMLPGPINSRALSEYADVLNMSVSQRLALESAHDEYRRQFRVLRDGEIASFLKEQRALQGGIPKRDVVEAMLEEIGRLQTKIAVLDDRLFSQMLPVLSAEQQIMVPRLRLARERDRYEAMASQANYGRRNADLSVLFRDLDLSADEFAATDSTMASYERRLTVIMRKQSEAVSRMTLDMMDILAERGFVEISQEELMKDPKLLMEVLEHIREAFTDLRSNAAKITNDLRDLNMRTYRQVAAVISPLEARRLRNGFYRGSYRQLAELVKQSEDDWMTSALQLDDLSPAHRELLQVASDEHQRRLGTLLDEGIVLIDAFWEGFSPFDMSPESGKQLRSDLADLQTQAVEARDAAAAIAEQEMGAEVVAEIRNAAIRLASRANEETAAEGEDDKATDEAATEEFAFSGDRFLPDRISRRDIKDYARRLQLEDDMSEVLRAIHTDYMERLSRLTVLEELEAARRAARDDDADAEAIDRVYTLRRQAIDAMAAADAAFFDELGAIVGPDAAPLLSRVRGTRIRLAYGGSASARTALGRDNTHEPSVDLVTILLEEQPTADELARVDGILTAYEERALSAIRARSDAQLDMEKMASRWRAEIAAAAETDIAAVIALQNRYRDVMKEPTARVEQTDRALMTLNRETRDLLLETLTGDRRGSIRRAYDLAAFPSIFEDPASVDRHLTAALALDDLTTDQRERLSNLGASYRSEYADLSQKMIAQLGTGAVNIVGLDPESFQAWQARQQELAKVRFDRNELNGRAISRLRATLTEEQIHRIGGLPEPLGEDEMNFLR